ncbi:cryptochrome/photolyase family protein [Alloalcanivorax marinus]|uniref:cryptochrome/photolyase family protein n=1 Tax=Alloalcanivorax marinus TaxID=1177169 RepID=UPI001EE3EE3B|nr:cryptochrome/photolyase family protein [Alloalcanivorax marinus]
MPRPRLILILGDQLSPGLSSLAEGNPARDRIVMAEVREEAGYVPHHRKKLVFLFSAMRHFAARLRRQGWTVDYHGLDQGLGDLCDAVLKSAREFDAGELLVTEPGEYRLREAMKRHWPQRLSLSVRLLEDRRFLCRAETFRDWAAGRKQLRMEFFYREMRRHTGLLMEPDGEPVGGRWNFDADNRKRYDGKQRLPGPARFEPDATTRQVIDLVAEHYPDRFGDLEPFWFEVTETQAEEALAHFLEQALPHFGDYQDAMTEGDDFLFHSLLSPYLNAGLLDPLKVCEAAERCYREGRAPLNAVEGFIRQILGWREYVRGIYWLLMPDYKEENRLASHADLPWFYWSGETKMRCVAEAVRATREHAYAHHIQRLMVTGNLALLLGVEVKQIHEWYLAVCGRL